MGTFNIFRVLRCTAFLFFTIFIFSALAYTQVGQIRGTVTDEVGNPISFANVFIQDTFIGAAARADGTYRIVNIPAGTHVVRVSAVGYRTSSASVTVTADETVTRNFTLATDILRMDAVVVSGTPGGAGVRKRDASFAITTMEAADIELFSPASTANLLEMVPGVWSESSGGVAGANIFVRGMPAPGDAPFVTMALNGSPIYGTQTLSFFEQSSIFRIDETVESVEALRGGPSSVFSNAEPGLTTNFMLRRGSDVTRGRLKYTTSDYNKQRIDAVLSGPVMDRFYYMIGGYVRTSPGVRSTQFNAEGGQQITVQLTRVFDHGVLNAFTRLTDDHGQWVLPMFLDSGNDPGTFAQLGNATRFRELQVNEAGDTEVFDFARGRGWKGSVSGLNASFDLGGGWALRNNLSYTVGEAPTYGFVPDGNAIQVSTLLAETDHTSVETSGGEALGGSDWIQNYGHWVVQKDLESLTNDLSLAVRAGDHDITLGFYQARWSSRDFWTLGNFTPVHNIAHGDFLQEDINCEDLAAAGSGSGCWSYGLQSAGDARTLALYAADSWQILPALRIDLGFRYEWFWIEYTLDDGALPNGIINKFESREGREFAFTGALNYDLTTDLGFFGRFTRSFLFPHFDMIRENIYSYDRETGRIDPNEFLQFEAGVKFETGPFGLFATGFLIDVDVFDGDVGAEREDALLNTQTIGVELDGAFSYEDFTIRAAATFQSGEIKESTVPDDVGNKIWRQPDWQFRVSPSYKFAFGNFAANVYAAVRLTGDRWDSRGNVFQLDGYEKVDLGAVVTAPGGLSFHIHGDNLTDSEGLTEGDPRIPGARNGRPIFGRSVKFSIGYDF